jgi:hypothetical protein
VTYATAEARVWRGARFGESWIAVFNVQREAIDVQLEAVFSDGHVGRTAFKVAPAERRALALSTLRPTQAAGQFDAGVRVTTSQPAAVSMALWDDPSYQRQGISRDLPRVPVCEVTR